MNHFLCILVVAMAMADVISGAGNETEPASLFGVSICPSEQCPCTGPNKFPGQIKDHSYTQLKDDGSTETVKCLCSCGEDSGGKCDDTDQCALGTICAAPLDWSSQSDHSTGVCSDRCSYTTCPQYHQCAINKKTGDAVCVCKQYTCSDTLLVPIKGQRGSEIRLFNNRCEMENDNCIEKERDPTTATWIPIAERQ